MKESQTCLVTGATGGIGLSTTMELARRGAKVIVHGRTVEKAERARRQIDTQVPGAQVEIACGDLSSLAEVRALADDVCARFPDLKLLINNAGVERWERHVTRDGFEETWAVNHLAPFLLSLRLLEMLRANVPARIINVSSVVHRWGRVDWDDLQLERGYGPERAYYRSKLALAMTSLELSRRIEATGVSVFLIAPGLTRTDFGREFRGVAKWWSEWMGRFAFREPESVGREIADLALGDRWVGKTGLYVSRGRVERPSARATDERAQRRLWDITFRDVGDPPAPPAARAPRPPATKRLLTRWFAACTAGELLGFGAAALMAWLTFLLVGMNPVSWDARLASLGLMVLAGVAEGTVLGSLQWAALRRTFPGLRARSWLGATITVAALGWFFGMLPATLMSPSSASSASDSTPPWALVLAAAVGFGAVAGAAFGFVQWLVLRRHAHDARRWIWANALGWAIGLPWSYLAGSTADLSKSVPAAIVVGAIAGAFMGASVALVTGRALLRIQPRGGPGVAT